jgi:flagellar biosynthesis protein FlhB
MSDHRTIEPSRRRIEQARGEGNVPHSRELTAGAGLLATVVAGEAMMPEVGLSIIQSFGPSVDSITPSIAQLVGRITEVAWSLTIPTLATLGAGWLAAILVHQIQIGGFLSTSLAIPDPRRLARFGGSNASDRASSGVLLDRLRPLVSQTARLGLTAIVVWFTLRSNWETMLGAMAHANSDSVGLIGSVVHSVALRIGLTLLALGLVDFGFEYMRWRSHLRLSPEEARDERRAMEGDPGARGRRATAARTVVTSPRGLATGATSVDAVAGPG